MIQALVLLALHGVLLTGPYLVGAELTARRTTSRATVLGGALVAVGVAGWLGGIAWFASPTLGRVLTVLVPLGCVMYLGSRRRWRRFLSAPELRTAVAAIAATAWYAAFVTALGFLWGGVSRPLDLSAARFSSPLPNDNSLPLSLAAHVAANGHSTIAPMVGDWLSSDRPPLQSAVVLAQAVTGTPSELEYLVTGVLLQSLWVVGVIALLVSFRVSRRVLLLATVAVGASGIVVVNTFFVWPKLLAAGFALAAVALVLRPTRTPGTLVMAAALSALAYLSHGGVAFMALPLAAAFGVAVVRLPTARLRTIALSGLCAALVVSPWVLYQRFVDPPGDRLLAWMLAGQVARDPRPFTTVLRDQYATVGLFGAMDDKRDNIGVLFAWTGPNHTTLEEGLRGWEGLVRLVHEQTFFSTLPAVGVLMLGLLGWMHPRRGPALMASRRMLALAGATLVTWCLLMFGPSSTLNHQGTFATQILTVVGLVCAASCRNTRFATVLVVAWVVAAVALYLPLARVPPGADPALFAQQDAALLPSAAIALAVVVAVGIVWLVRSGGFAPPGDEEGTSVPEPERHPTTVVAA